MLNDITLYNNIDGPRAIMIRHAKRFSIESMEKAFEALLTEDGKEMAYLYGTLLQLHSPVYLYHSPVERCKQTIEYIQKGLCDKNMETIQPLELFDLGGPYVRAQWDKVIELIEKIGYEEFLRYWFDGNTDPEIIMPLDEAARLQIEILKKQLDEQPEATHINISHDWNIMIIREHYLGLKHEQVGYPDFLDGVSLYYKNKRLFLQYHKHVIELTG